ncbi:DUF2336 domain-containing protein [Rhizobium sp.]|uniref:DUF2336 domain-containing protein n=1 Tax=Rhizobium sp. TaxID=391 RepID=UPI00391711BB
MIVQVFLRWAETARTGDRARAASALAKAFVGSSLGPDEHRAAIMAMTYLLDDPSPKVRLSLAEALASSDVAPRPIIMSLAEDQPEIACTVIACSPVLRDADLVELAGRGDSFTRSLVATRPGLGCSAAAAVAEVGDGAEIVLLLENDTASISRITLRRMAQRFGHLADVRHLLLERGNLPADARHMLVAHVAAALAGSDLVTRTIGAKRIDVMTREAGDEAIVAIAGSIFQDEIPLLVEHLKTSGRLTPALLIHALCSGKVDFFASAIVSLVHLEERRVRAILATGRVHAVRALFEAAGIGRDIVAVFVEAVFLWRRAAAGGGLDTCYLGLLEQFEGLRGDGGAVGQLLDMVDLLHRGELRRSARSYAADVSLVA